jgi:hypothetical protein
MKKLVLTVLLALAALPIFAEESYSVVSDSLNVRKGPGANYDVLGRVYKDESRVQILVKEKADKPLKDFIESLDINYNDYNANRQLDKLPRANESVKIAQSLGITVEYLVTGVKPDKPDIVPVIQKLESALEEIRKLDS